MIIKHIIMLLLVFSILFSIVSTVIYFSDTYFHDNIPMQRYSQQTHGNPTGGLSLIIEGDTVQEVNHEK